MNIIDELTWRGAINQQTDEKNLYELCANKSISLYCGVDPTGDSMHIGHLTSSVYAYWRWYRYNWGSIRSKDRTNTADYGKGTA